MSHFGVLWRGEGSGLVEGGRVGVGTGRLMAT